MHIITNYLILKNVKKGFVEEIFENDFPYFSLRKRVEVKHKVSVTLYSKKAHLAYFKQVY